MENRKISPSGTARSGTMRPLGELGSQFSELMEKGGLSGAGDMSDMGEKPSGEWLPEQYPTKPPKPQNSLPISLAVEDNIEFNTPKISFSKEELLAKLKIPNSEELWKAINIQGSLYQYLVDTREDGDELFEYIKHDLISWIYGDREKNTKHVEQFIKGVAIIGSKIKKDLKNFPIVCSIIDFIGSQEFYTTYINKGLSVIDCFLDVKVKPSYDLQVVDQIWKDFKGIIKNNNSLQDYNLYVSSIVLMPKKNITGSGLVEWCFLYPGKLELAQDYANTFDGDLVYTFVEYAKKVLGIDRGFYKLISIQYGTREAGGRSEYELLRLAKSQKRPQKIQSKQPITIHSGNCDANSLLSKWLNDQLLPATDDSIKHCLISGPMGSGKTTIIKHYLSEMQYKFPRSRIGMLSLEDLAKDVSSIAQETNKELKSKAFEEFITKLQNFDVIYMNDFDKVIKGKYWIKGELLKIMKFGHTRFILESEMSLNLLEDSLENDNHTSISDPEKRKYSKTTTKDLRRRLFENVYDAQNIAPTPLARKEIIQNIAQTLLGTSLPIQETNYLARMPFQITQYYKIIKTIQYRLKDIVEIDQIVKKAIDQNATSGIALPLAKVYDWFEEFFEDSGLTNSMSGSKKSEMFAAYTYMMTDEPNIWNPTTQYRTKEEIARHSGLRSKRPSHKKFREYFIEHRLYHEEWCRVVSIKISDMITYGGFLVDTGEQIEIKFPSKDP